MSIVTPGIGTHLVARGLGYTRLIDPNAVAPQVPPVPGLGYGYGQLIPARGMGYTPPMAVAAQVEAAVSSIVNARVPVITTWQQQIVRGRSDAWTIAVTTGGAPLNLAGAVITALGKRWLWDADSAALISKSTADGSISVAMAAAGVIVVPFAPADTAVSAIPLWVSTLAISVKLALAGVEVDLSPPGATISLLMSAIQAN